MSVFLQDFKTVAFLILASTLVFLLDNFHFLEIPKAGLEIVSTPIQYGLYQTGKTVAKQWDIIYQARFRVQENQALKQQLSELLSENANLEKQLSDTQKLVDQQNSLNLKTFNLIPARVLSAMRYLTIDRGTDDGIQVGSIVVFKDNYIGRISSVTPKTSQVMLAQDPDSKVAVFTKDKDGNAKGIVEGQFGSVLLMDKILHQEPINKDDYVYTSGIEQNTPKGLIVGKIDQVLEQQNQVFKQAVITPIYQVSDLDIVFVIKEQ